MRLQQRTLFAVFLSIALGVGIRSDAAVPFETFNESQAPGNALWINDEIGWYWTPDRDMQLAGIQTKLRTAININNNFDFTTTFYTERPAVGGEVMGSFSWNGTDFDGPWLGGMFDSPLSLTGGTSYFLGMSGWKQAVNSRGPNSGAGINWVFPLNAETEHLGVGSSYTGADYFARLNPNLAAGPSTTDAGIVRFLEHLDLEFDFNSDCLVNVDDIDALVEEIVSGTNDVSFDLTGDEIVNTDDLTSWLSLAATQNGFEEPYLIGDINLDGAVNAGDLNRLALSWRQDVARWSAGDVNADGSVNSADLNQLALRWRQSVPVAAANQAVVPEPAAGRLAVYGLALVWWWRRRNRQ